MREAKRDYKRIIGSCLPYAAIIVLVLLFYFTTGGAIFSKIGFNSLVAQTMTVLLVACGSIFVYSHGSLDLSMGALMALGSLVFVNVVNSSGSVLLGSLSLLTVTVGGAFLVGFITTTFGLPSFITSLCMMLAGKGIVSLATIKVPYQVLDKSIVNFNGLNNLWVRILAMLLCAAICFFLFRFTRIGRYNKLIGGNRKAAAQVGISLRKYIIIAFVISGVLTAIATFFALTRTGSMSRTFGEGLELNVMIALMLGGMPLNGGAKTKFSNAIIGSVLIALLECGLSLWGIKVEWVYLVEGIIFIIVVGLNFQRSNKLLPR